MSTPAKKPMRAAWRGACHTCRAIAQACYSALVLLLAVATLFAAYVATLDDIPVPNFLVRELQNQLQTQGVALRLEGMRFQPNGRVTLLRPELHSPKLGATILSADRAVAKLKLSRLLLGELALDELKIASGRFVLPAMLTPSGEPTTAVSSINLEATHRGQRWNIGYANFALSGLKLSLNGRFQDRWLELPPPQPDAPKPDLNQFVLDLAPRITRAQQELARFQRPFAIVELDVVDQQQIATLEFGAERLRLPQNAAAHDLSVHADYRFDGPLDLDLQTGRLDLPRGLSVAELNLRTQWPAAPSPEQWLPPRVHATLADIAFRGSTLPSLIATARPGSAQHRATLQFALPDAPVSLQLLRNNDSGFTSLALDAVLDTATLHAAAPLARNLADLDLLELAQLPGGVDLRATALLNRDLQPISAQARATSGPAAIMGAAVDYASAATSLAGPQIDARDIRLVNGPQAGVIDIGYNLDTRFRRILVEGSFDPTLINGWFKPWWSAMWDGMDFPDQGMLTYLDSQATFLRPDTVRVTGLGRVQDMDLRGLPVKELRTRIFSRFRYVDLYDLELFTHDQQQAYGNVQFHMDRDTRDEKDKLTGIWIDAISTLDVKKAPQILWEIADAAADILAPYCYHRNPLIEARSSSVRVKDQYLNDIDLHIETPHPFAFYGFPFESLQTSVHIGDDLIDIPNAQGQLGGGQVELSAFIAGDGIELELDLADANFGQVLNAANTYFARDGSDTAQQMDTERLLAYGGTLNADFAGFGIVGDPLSYYGDGSIDIADADFGKFQLFGLLSMALEVTPLRFTTLKFRRASGPYSVLGDTVRLSETTIEGPVAVINSEGTYHLETDALDFRARLYPFRNTKVPIISPLINLPLNIVSNVFEVTVTGTFDQPKLRLFNPATKEEIDVEAPRDARNPRPAPR